MQFTLEIELDNAVFDCGADDKRDTGELARLLNRLGDTLRVVGVVRAQSPSPIRDGNGNTVGHWVVTP